MKCQICGTALGDDLFSAVTGEKVCSICKVKFIGGLPTSPAMIKQARDRRRANTCSKTRRSGQDAGEEPMKTLQEITADIKENGAARVLLNPLTGHAVSPTQLKLMGGNPLDMAFYLIRDDGWSLGCLSAHLKFAWSLFAEQWIGLWIKGMDAPIPLRADQVQVVDQVQEDLENLEHCPPNRLELCREDGGDWEATAHWGDGDEVVSATSTKLLVALTLLTERLVALQPEWKANETQ